MSLIKKSIEAVKSKEIVEVVERNEIIKKDDDSNDIKNKKEIISKFWNYGRFVIVPFVIFIVAELFYKFCNVKSAKSPYISSHIFGFIVFLSIFYLVFGIAKTLFKTAVITSILTAVLMFINQIKIVYSSNPIFLGDIKFVTTADTFTDIMKENVWEIIVSFIIPFLIMVTIYSMISYLCYRYDCTLGRVRNRVISSVVCLAFIFIVIGPIQPVNDLIIDSLFSIDEKKNNNTVSNVKYYYQHSFFGGIVGDYLNTKLREPEGYNSDEIKKIISQADKQKKDWGKPNIIMVFSESLFDITKIEEVEFDVDVLKNFHELSKKGEKFEMLSPNFGGISCNPEFEMTTGGSLKFFPNNYIAFMNLYTSDKYLGKTSIYTELNNNGYTTKIGNCWGKNLFNVENVYKYFQVDYVDYLKKVKGENDKGGRISDDYLADLIISEFENKDDNPMFYMTLTAENHMPFTEMKFDEYDINIKASSLDDEKTGIIKSYAQGCYDADKQLKKLYDFIQSYEEPTLLIFYGDHLPFLKTDDGEDVYESLKYFNTDDDNLNTYRLYNTQCLILDNFGAKYENIDYLSYDLVMSYVFNHMDLDLSDFYKWLYTTIDVLPSSNRYVSIDKNGNIYNTGDLPENMMEMYKLREWVNWYSFVE